MKNSKHLHLVANLVNGYERERSEYELARALHAPKPPAIRKRSEGRDAFDDCCGHAVGGIGLVSAM